jgi:hypothetical protein
MLRGRFAGDGSRPFIDALLYIPALQIEGMVSFLIDTGADTTVLMPFDAKRLNVDYTKLTTTAESLGVGGKSVDHIVAAALAVRGDDGITHAYQLQLRVLRNDPILQTVPSLLGRDVINRWRLHYHPMANELTADVISSDRQFALR